MTLLGRLLSLGLGSATISVWFSERSNDFYGIFPTAFAHCLHDLHRLANTRIEPHGAITKHYPASTKPSIFLKLVCVTRCERFDQAGLDLICNRLGHPAKLAKLGVLDDPEFLFNNGDSLWDCCFH